ncbi:MAG: Uma2 family endonuclease [Bacteroidia bacterium]|nr:Uma2 family endonuclease [Bacteroidia bacterium]
MYNNVHSYFAGQEVFIAADLLWYPVQGDPRTVVAPDVMLAFGRPDGDRASYLQWLEDNVAPQVVFEVLSPSNTPMEMLSKQAFYFAHGVEELIVIDPGKKEGDPESFFPCLRQGEEMVASPFAPVEWTSPRLGFRFRVEDGKLQIFFPDGSAFRSFTEIMRGLDIETERANRAEAELEAMRARLRDLEG